MTIAQDILQEIGPYLTQHMTVWVGFSGGVDSSVLLHALGSLTNRKFDLKAIHINHQLSPHADVWQRHCEEFAANLGLEIESHKVDVHAAGEGMESAARKARYGAFASTLAEGDLLLCAHHADDQAETLLYRLVRGAGLRGLKGMVSARTVGAGTLLRPMLFLSRRQLEDYAKQHKLVWVEDESNQDLGFDRNYLRNALMPLLQTRWPGCNTKMQQTAQWLAEADSLLKDYARQDLAMCDLRSARLGQSLNLEALVTFAPDRQKHVLREWVELQGYSAPENKHFTELEKLIRSAQDSEALVAWGQCEVRRFRQRVYLLPRLRSMDEPGSIVWQAQKPLPLVDGGILELTSYGLTHQTFSVRYRQGGERCRPINRSHSQTLKKLLQEYALEPWLRDRVPLIYAGETLIAVGDLFVCGISAADGNTGNGRLAELVNQLEFSWIYP